MCWLPARSPYTARCHDRSVPGSKPPRRAALSTLLCNRYALWFWSCWIDEKQSPVLAYQYRVHFYSTSTDDAICGNFLLYVGPAQFNVAFASQTDHDRRKGGGTGLSAIRMNGVQVQRTGFKVGPTCTSTSTDSIVVVVFIRYYHTVLCESLAGPPLR